MTAFIDTHHHIWDPAVADYTWMTDELAAIRRKFDIDDFAAVMGPAGVTGSILVQTRSSFEESQQFLEIAEDTPSILGVVAWVDLTSPKVLEDLHVLKSGKGGAHLVGVRHQVHDEEDETWLLREDVRRGLRALDAQSLTYDLLLRPRELPAAIKLVRDMPTLHWVLDHIAKPDIAAGGWEPWSNLMRDLAEASPTCWVRLSGMVTEADWANWSADDLKPYIDHVLECFGPDRCMLGSDWPVCLLAASYQTVLSTARELISHLPNQQQIGILAGNAAAAYRL